MAIKPTRFIWHNGSVKRWQDACVHVMAHGLHYGSSVFEGIRAYDTPTGPAVFRLRAHVRRFYESAQIYGLPVPYAPTVVADACRRIAATNDLRSAYIRPIAYRGFGSFSLGAVADAPVEVAVGAIEWGAYLGKEAIERGVDVGVSSWTRMAPSSVPALAKAGGHYLSSQLIAQEAARHGYAEGIALDAAGHISEGSGENVFVVRDGVIFTPPSSASILVGITRDTVMTLARQRGIEVREQTLPREALYIADEVFMTGTAAEITPVRSVDGVAVRDGTPGPITQSLQKDFFGLFSGATPDRWGWLEPVTPTTVVRARNGARPGRNGKSSTRPPFEADDSRRVPAGSPNGAGRTARPCAPIEPCPW